MAIDILRKDITAAIVKYSDENLRKLLNKTGITEIRITKENSIEAFIKGVNAIMKAARYDQIYIDTINNQYNTESVWSDVIDSIYTKLNSISKVEMNHKLKRIEELSRSKFDTLYILSSSTPDLMICRVYSNENTAGKPGQNLDTFLKAFRRLAFNEWKKRLPKEDEQLKDVSVETGKTRFQTLPKYNRRGERLADTDTPTNPKGQWALGAFGTGNPFAHDNETTVGKYGLQAILNQLSGSDAIQEALEYRGLQNFSKDLVSDIMEALDITFREEEIDMPDGGTRITRSMEVGLIKGELRSQKVELADWRNIRKYILTQGGLENTITKTVAAMNPRQALEAEGSKSARERIADKAVKKIVESASKNKRAVVKKKPKIQKARPKKLNIKGTQLRIRKAKPTKLSSIRKIAIGGKLLRQQEKKETGKGQKTTSLATLKRKLNQRLPAEVRRNMGRPALINRTGRFSNSVRIENLYEAQNTIVGEYTYRLNPYETFENTGDRLWPVGYNPKPLITKSIRNLAGSYVENKFTLRRV